MEGCAFEQAMVYEIMLFGPIVGGPDCVVEIAVGPGNLILASAFGETAWHPPRRRRRRRCR